MTPSTLEELVVWFARGENATHDEAILRPFAARMLSLPDPVDGSVMTAAKAWKQILDHGFLAKHEGQGWITREGRLLTAFWGAHDRLLYWLGITPAVAERVGWARAGIHEWQCRFRLASVQKRLLVELGHLVDSGHERLKPAWRGRPVTLEDCLSAGE